MSSLAMPREDRSFSKPYLVDEVAADRVLQVLLPVDLDGVLDVVLVVRRSVLVDLDDDDLRVVEVRLDPVGVYQDVAAAHVFSSGAVAAGCGSAGAMRARPLLANRGGIRRARGGLKGAWGNGSCRPAQTVRQSMAATRHRSTARRFVRSACRFMPPIVGTHGRPCHRRVAL